MDEVVNAFDLSPEQQDTAALTRRLLGGRIADRYVDFCRLAAGGFPLRVSSPIAAHALRELESILRETLEVPMDLAVTLSSEHMGRVKKAKALLKELGYGDEEIQRASNQLRPRLTHKEKIEGIVVRLGLAADGDVARAWKSISQAHGEAHGGRALHQSFTVDDAFRAEWQAPFDTMIRGLMIALQGKYTAFMRRIDELVATPDRGAAVRAFSKEIPGALSLLWHFFNQLKTSDWLPHLAKWNLLLAPQSLPDKAGNDGLLLGQWPAGSYLLRMAKSTDATTRRQVTDSLRTIASSTHPDTQQMGLEILAALPPSEAAPLVDIAEGWLVPGARFVVARAPHDLIKGFADEGQLEAALRMTRALFAVFPNNGEVGTLFDRYMYEHFLPEAAKALAPVCGADAVGLLTELLDQAVRISGKVSEDPPHDFSYHLFGAISGDGTRHDVIESLVGGIVRASKVSIDANPKIMREMVSRIRSRTPKIFSRIGLHVLAMNPGEAPDLAEASLIDQNLIGASWCRVEYGELASAWFPLLSAARQTEILAYVDSLPDHYRDRWKERFQSHNSRPPNADDERDFEASIIRDALWYWRDVLPADRRVAVEMRGDPDAWLHSLQEADKSPLDGSDFASRPLEEVVAFLASWRPASGEKRETITALGQELRNAATNNAGTYSTGAIRFSQLAPIYARRVLEGLSNAVQNKRGVDWAGILALIEAVADRTGPAPSSTIEGDDPDWSWARKAAIDLLAAGLRQGQDGITFDHTKTVHDLVLAFYGSAPRQPDTDSFEESYRTSPYFGAQSTSRGGTVELCILLIYWMSRYPASEVGKAPREALDKLPDIKAILETELEDKSSDGRIPRAIIGRYLNWLKYFAEPWLFDHLSALFPSDDLTLRDAAWRAHLIGDSWPNPDLATAMRACYVAEIGRLNEVGSGNDQQHVEERLAEYLVILYIRDALPDAVFELFWKTAPARVRKRAMWFLGTQLGLPEEILPKDRRLRAYSYWDRRLAAAKSSADPACFREELSAIGVFFHRDGIDAEWLMDQTIAMSEAGFVPGESYSIIDRLAKLSSNFPDRAAQTVAALVKNQHLDRWVHTTQTAAMRSIFVNGLATGSPSTDSAITEAINYLATLGDTSCLDLLR